MNKRPLKSGDLCLIVRGNLAISQCVLLRRIELNEKFVDRYGDRYQNLSGRVMWEVDKDKYMATFVKECNLMRVGDNPDAETETVEEEEEISA